MATSLPKVEIHLAERGGTIKVDGVELKCVQSLSIEADRDRRNVLLRLIAGEIDVTAESAEVLARYSEPQKPALPQDRAEINSLAYLVKNGLPLDVALTMTAEERSEWIVAFGEMDGGEWDWDAMRWKTADRHVNVTLGQKAAIPRSTLDCRGPTDGVGRVSFPQVG